MLSLSCVDSGTYRDRWCLYGQEDLPGHRTLFGSCNSEGMKAVDSSGFAATLPNTGMEEFTPECLYYFNARWYDPGLGRFITEDPIKDGINWHVYVANNPMTMIDPTGLWSSSGNSNDNPYGDGGDAGNDPYDRDENDDDDRDNRSDREARDQRNSENEQMYSAFKQDDITPKEQ